MRGAIRPPSIRRHGLVLEATRRLFASASLPVRPTRLAAGSLPSRTSPKTADTRTATSSFYARVHLAACRSALLVSQVSALLTVRLNIAAFRTSFHVTDSTDIDFSKHPLTTIDITEQRPSFLFGHCMSKAFDVQWRQWYDWYSHCSEVRPGGKTDGRTCNILERSRSHCGRVKENIVLNLFHVRLLSHLFFLPPSDSNTFFPQIIPRRREIRQSAGGHKMCGLTFLAGFVWNISNSKWNCLRNDQECMLVSMKSNFCRSQWPRGLRRRSAAPRQLRSRVRIPPGVGMDVCLLWVLPR